MNRAMSILTAAGLGAGMMYFLDPRNGRRRRAFIRDKAVRLSHEIQEAGETIQCDVRNRWKGLAAGDLSVLVGGKNALRGNPLRGSWSPAGRALLGAIGGGLFLSGLMSEAPRSCILGTVGLALMIEGATNAGIEDIQCLVSKGAKIAAETSGHDGHAPERRQSMPQMSGASS